LTWSFGIRPAISDILDTLNAHQKVSKRLKYFRSYPGRYVPIRVRKELLSSCDEVPGANPNPSFNDDFQWFTTNKSSTGVIGCWGRLREDLSFADDWTAYLQYFGINKVIGLAWELIPFSFVLDWFTNAQERINSLTRFHTGSPYSQFTNFWSSTKEQSTQKLFFIPGRDSSFGGPTTSPSSAYPVATIVETEYIRTSSIPDTSGVFDFSALGLFHGITAGGLIIQRL
jgi:hypothetical protein